MAITYNPGQLNYAKGVLGDGSMYRIKIDYILQEKPMGLANIVEVCEKWIDKSKFVLHLGDSILFRQLKI